MKGDVALALQPLHLAQAICEIDPARGGVIILRGAQHLAPALACRRDITVAPIEDRHRVLRMLKACHDPFTAIHATPWNRTALRLERAALASGGKVTLVEDGIGCYRKAGSWTAEGLLRRAVHRVVDGGRYAPHVAMRTQERNVRLVSLWPEMAAASPRPEPLDPRPFQAVLPELSKPLAALAVYRGLPVYFDTNDVDSGWLTLEQKLAILKDILPRQRMVYFRHPYQRDSLAEHFDNLIDLTDQAKGWNEMAAYVIGAERMYSTFSSAALGLRRMFGVSIAHTTLHAQFLERTGAAGYEIGPDIARVIA
ncbi:hypothetical protein SLNSH_17420 [Alsobacter soli]|uniref:Uncharacterized protein n=1 Tax=Alsobacter soli TaxID=2109933 RepID=A0A2T1HPZ7_9HYPH|nr:hypothetical protein [Alsobacter soli]PSC03724.1 hypothetical protein SLNSH_17420 [Alsobacter soli]